MRIEGTYLFDAPRETVWEALMDPNVLAKALPGGDEMEQVGENQYEAALDVRVGPVQGKFNGDIEITDIHELESYHMKVNGQGTAGFLNGEGDVALSDAEEGKTLMTYSGDAQVGGRLAGVGQRLIDSTAKSLTRQGLESLDRQIQARQEATPEEPVPDVPPPSTAAVATNVARDVTKDTMNNFVAKAMAPERIVVTLVVVALVVTLLFALIAWLIAG